MANLIDRLAMAGLISLLALPVQAQEAAFEQPTTHAATQQPGQHMQIRPISTSAPAQESASNLKHWSRFSSSSAKPMFVRVPAGTQTNSGESHYIRPNRVLPGTLKANAQSSNGAVKRYLAYNVAPGACFKNSSSAASPQKKASSAQKSKSNTHVVALGYGKNSGEVTYSLIPNSKTVAVSCYPRYR